MNSPNDSFLESLNEAARQNPLAAAAIGAGAVWLLLGSKSLARASGAGLAAAGATFNAAQAGVQKTAEVGSKASSSITENVGKLTDKVRSTSWPEINTNAFTEASEKTGAAARSMQSAVVSALESQPLLLGAVGLAIGAAIASAKPPTSTEQRLLGATAGAAREQIEKLGADARERIGDIVSNVTAEADKQGLSSDGVQEASSAVMAKIKTVADETTESFKRSFKNGGSPTGDAG